MMHREHGGRRDDGSSADQVRGAFRIDLGNHRTWWSPGIWLLLGLPPRSGEPAASSLRVMIRHRDPDDRPVLRDAWKRLRDTQRPVCFDARIASADGRTRPVTVIADLTYVDGGLVVQGLVVPRSLPPTNSWPAGRPEVVGNTTGSSRRSGSLPAQRHHDDAQRLIRSGGPRP